MSAFALLLLALATPTVADAGQGSSCSPLTSVVVPQRSYAQLNVAAFDQRVFVYAPDIESGFGGDFKSFQLWIVEGVYGKPFVKSTGAMDEREFERIRASRNVKATSVVINGSERQKRVPLTIAKQRVALDITVNTSFAGTDRVAISVCR